MKQLCMMSLLALVACGANASDPGYQVLDAKAEPLRTAFNEARGKVRAIFLAAPA